ncbi:uncharacterized protein K460DRAFT_278077 [Cucurbitaria berberidis CBS 394.84]|uniref:Rhodopsin domain-containing protein n=1 Tax=Cucurbitaria berberidis CBS 394.84 TaxID=1168544 RepID=A0A9P4GM44_9PLEO|nr:uncharacterized protein K460DRAFT_278077 [Cucurbitaria berberidis CBS 394.84]KAF1847846.1 hypothetical protein K460DRAFT_278077 [Cucurbitaria berberidis CBS 394.84]
MHSHSPSWFVLSSKGAADIRYTALIPAVVSTIFAFSMVVLRWYSRIHCSSGSIKAEDYFVTAALVKFNIDAGKLRQKAMLTPLPVMLKLVFTQSILYHLSINLVKVSFTLQYIRLFSVIPEVVYCCYALLVLIFGVAAGGVFGIIFLCKPVQSYWNITVSGTCIDAEDLLWATSIIGIILDCAIWLLPIPVIGRLRLPRRQKMSLLVVFGLGGFVCIVSILRLVLVHDAAHRFQYTKSGTYAIVFSTIELNISIICASLLVMKPLFVRFLPSIVSEQHDSAREDRRLWRGMTGLDLLDGLALDEEEKDENDGRRDTAIGMGRIYERSDTPDNAWDSWRRLESR